MDDFHSYIQKDIITSIIELETFQIGDIKYGIAITKFAWYACRLYCSHQLKVHKYSPLYKAIKKEKFVPWSYSFKYKTKEAFIFEKVDFQSRSQHFTLAGAQAKLKELKHQCESGQFEGSDNYPKYFQYFSEFCQPEENQMETKLEGFLNKNDRIKLELNQIEVLEKDQADKLVNKLVFPDKTIVKTMRLNDILTFNYYGTPSLVIYSRTFYHIESIPYTDGNNSLSIHHKHEYSYNKTFCCYLKKSKNQLELLKKSNELDISFLISLVKKQWELIFEPQFFYDSFSTRILHKKNWQVMSPEELNETIQLGSILRVNRKNGAYFHAGVYLGWDLIIHVSVRKSDFSRKREIFNFETFENFMRNSSEVEEIRFLVPRFSRNELYERAIKMNKEEVSYKLVENNCEHLASLLTTGLKHSLQLGNPLRKFVAKLIGESFETSNSSV